MLGQGRGRWTVTSAPKLDVLTKNECMVINTLDQSFQRHAWLFKNFNFIVFSSNGQKQLHRQLYILQKPITRARRNALYYTYNIYNLFMLIYIFGAIWNLQITFHSVQYTHPLSWLHEDFHSSLGFYKTIFFSIKKFCLQTNVFNVFRCIHCSFKYWIWSQRLEFELKISISTKCKCFQIK